ncbi:hypothetical protein ACFYY8_15505 [Streptosporangium sp. NPDC001559]|uniref:hypothetical protein n=1 Tax=Streptosporangium sp. NPDC001559 TaxID=3366187 RepID=UPI0036E4D5CF
METGGNRRRRSRSRSRLPGTLRALVGAAALVAALLVLGGSLLRPGARTQEQEMGRALVTAPVAAPAETGGSAKDPGKAAEKAAADKPGKAKKGQEAKAGGLSKHTDKQALAYFIEHKATKRLKDIRIVGGYLRIYTDLPDSASNSKQALKLCETGRDYLVGEVGDPNPVVFVQARFGENGNPVLANIIGSKDRDCRLTYPEPK